MQQESSDKIYLSGAGGRGRDRLPASIWALGFASLFMDTSSELIHSVLPLFMVSTLGVSVITVGIVEGIAEATASIMKIFSGALSDYLGRRKLLMIVGYGLAVFTKPIFPLANSITWVFTARFVDRIGKGIRGAPRDALVADITPPQLRGAAYGLRQALDSVGAVLGPVLAVILLMLMSNSLRSIMWIAVVPAVLCLLLLIIYVHEPEKPADTKNPHVTFRDASLLPMRYWLVVLAGAVFTLARFSEAFLVLRAQNVGMRTAFVPAIMVVMNLFYAASAFPAGVAADHMNKRMLLTVGLGFLIAADVLLAVASGPALVLTGAALWGLHMAFTQGLLSKLVADSLPTHLRGTGFGLFNLVAGIALLLASVIAGTLWTRFGPATTFLAGAAFTAMAAAGLLFPVHRKIAQ